MATTVRPRMAGRGCRVPRRLRGSGTRASSSNKLSGAGMRQPSGGRPAPLTQLPSACQDQTKNGPRAEAGAARLALVPAPPPEYRGAMTAGPIADYQVVLDTFRGPLDLLLYLVKRDEVDVLNIPIARVAEQFKHYLDVLTLIDIERAGEFLVMAATLMEIKSKM